MAQIRTHQIGIDNGIQVELLNLGATVRSIKFPLDGRYREMTLTLPTLDDYAGNSNYCGSTVGRYANRIANARFSIDDQVFSVPRNDASGRHCLHGGDDGFHSRFWALSAADSHSATYTCDSVDGDSGFPGNLKVDVTYRVTDGSSLRIDYVAECDKATVVNLSNHTYFNLNGPDDKGMLSLDDHLLYINSAAYTPTDASGLPTGDVADVEGTVLDFRQPQNLAARIQSASPPLQPFGGYDHNFVLVECDRAECVVAGLYSPAADVSLEVLTSQPGLQLYSSNATTAPIGRHTGICLEAQNFPDSPNQPAFPDCVLRPGDIYREFIVYRLLPGRSDALRA